jgi:hypothetical protein
MMVVRPKQPPTDRRKISAEQRAPGGQQPHQWIDQSGSEIEQMNEGGSPDTLMFVPRFGLMFEAR